MSTYFFGLDVGTQGARVVLVDEKGELLASDSRKFQLDDNPDEFRLSWQILRRLAPC